MLQITDKKYCPIPFWSWNEKLNTEETKKQVDMMAEAGMGGFFMHARGGLQTAYMGEEWFENVSASIEEAKKQGMHAWAYDENGWPSGFGNGIVTGFGEEFQQKYLRMETEEKHGDTQIYHEDGWYFYYEVNPFYSDNLNAEATKMFVHEIYLPYYEKYKNALEGFFTDEPQLSRKGIPWSHVLPKAYMEEYGEDLLPHLKELFLEIGDHKKTRIRFWRLVTVPACLTMNIYIFRALTGWEEIFMTAWYRIRYLPLHSSWAKNRCCQKPLPCLAIMYLLMS